VSPSVSALLQMKCGYYQTLYFGCQTYTFQRGSSRAVSLCPTMTQSSPFHGGRCTFGSQNVVPKICEYVKSGHTFGRHAVTLRKSLN
jgi:hypothetical protein